MKNIIRTREVFNVKKRNCLSALSELFFIACMLSTGAFGSAYAATYYVSPSGNDANAGTSLSAPVKTITKALSKANASGDTIYVLTGTYAESINIKQNGITLSAYSNNSPVIDGNPLAGRDWIALLSVDGNGNRVSGFEVKYSNVNKGRNGGYGVQVSGHHNTISKLNVHHTWANGILLHGDYNTVEDSTVSQTSLRTDFNPSAGWDSALSAARGSSSSIKSGITSFATIRRNKVFNSYGEGLSCYEADNCVVEDNVIYDNRRVNLYLSDATNSVVRRNMVYITLTPKIGVASDVGIALADEKSAVPRSSNNTIVNNLLYHCEVNAFKWSLVANSGLKNVTIAYNTIVGGNLFTNNSANALPIVNSNSQIKNNIIMGTDVWQIGNTGGIAFSNNNWFGIVPHNGISGSDIIGDPQIVRSGAVTPGNMTANYFLTRNTSPVRGKATPLSNASDDFFKTSRGSSPDIGGYQFIQAPAQQPANTSSVKISSYSVSNVSRNSATIKWSTNVPATGRVFYFKPGNSLNAPSITIKNASTSQTANVTGLTPNTVYEFSIWAWANGGLNFTPNPVPSFKTAP